MKDGGIMSGDSSVGIDHDVVMATEEVNKSKSPAPVSEDRGEVNAVEGRDDCSASENNRGVDDERTTEREDDKRTTEREDSVKNTKPSPSRKPRSGSNSSSQGRFQGKYQGRAPYHHPGAPRNPPNGPPYPHPPYGYATGPAGGPHDPYRGGPPPPPPPHYHQGPPMPHPGQYGAPPGGPYHPGSAYHPMPGHPGGPNYRVPQYPVSSHPYATYPGGPHQGMYPAPSDSSSIASTKSKSSKASNSKGPSKKRTISGIDEESKQELSAYAFRRSGSSNASTSSTVTAGNNTSTETPYLTEDSPQKTKNRGSELPPLSSANLFEDADQLCQVQQHRRNNSTSSTASSSSVGGFSLSSYDRLRGNGGEDSAMIKSSPKKRKNSHGSAVDASSLHRRVTSNSSHSVDVAGAPSRFQKLSMEDAASIPPSGAAASHNRENSSRNLFLTMSTSPINAEVEATPHTKNTKKSIGSSPSDPMQETNSFDRGGDTPTPTEAMAERDMMTNEHMLNQHLRSQSFTPLSHLANGSDNGPESISNSPTMNNQAFQAIAPQLSWSIAGDAPSLADLAEWEEEIHNSRSSDHNRDNSMASKGSFGQREGVLSPNSDIAMNEEGNNAETTPLPVFFGGHPISSEERENVMKAALRFETGVLVQPQYGDAEHIHQLFLSNGGRGSSSKAPFRTSHGAPDLRLLPPTPVFSEQRDHAFGRSPLNSDGPQNFFSSSMFGHPSNGMHNDRVRNLRGRVPGGMMQLQIPGQAMSHHHNLTSPMGLGPKWGPGGMHPPVPSPHHMSSVSSKRKCVPLKPPIPSKFQGDIEKVKTSKVPEFANLVNFPNHMSQKQSVNLPDGMRCCVMCGQACPCSTGNKNKRDRKAGKTDGGLAPRNSNGQDVKEKQSNGYAIIPTQNKGLCTLCDVNVWVVTQSGLEIKWCKGCKNFRPWAAFGDKGLATKCLRCRERQREKYALQKEEKERARIVSKTMAKGMAKAAKV